MSINERKKILIIEDEKDMAQALEIKLSQANFFTKVAPNGGDALAILAGELFDLIILDLIMPKVDGYEMLRIMKERGLTIPVIILTNVSSHEDEMRTRQLGVSDYFVKTNISIDEIVERVKKKLKVG